MEKFTFNKKWVSLIDSFYIIGYSQKEDNMNITNDTNTNHNIPKPYPTILSTIPCLYQNATISEFDIIHYLFPYPPNIYSSKIEDISKKDYNLCFSFKDNKINLYVYAYVFYELSEDKSCYIPKCFCITSRFALFSFFKMLTRKIQFDCDNSCITMPLEIILFNMIHFFPPPIKNQISVDFSITKRMKIKGNIMQFEILPKEILQIKIHEVQGFPYIDFNANQILNVIDQRILAMIMTLTYFNISIILYSERIDELSPLLQLISKLSYPFEDSPIFNNLVVFSKEILNEPNCERKIENRIIGINDDINISSIKEIGSLPFCVFCKVDAKKDEFMINYWESNTNDPINQSYVDLFNYLLNAIKTYEIEDQTRPRIPQEPLAQIMYNLIDRLNNIIDNTFDSFYVDDSYKHSLNYSIQNSFYQFHLDIMGLFYSTFSFKSNYDKLLLKYKSIYVTKNRYSIEYDLDFSIFELVVWTLIRESDSVNRFFNLFMNKDECSDSKRNDFFIFQFFLQYNKYMKDNKKKIDVNYMSIMYDYFSSLVGNTVYFRFSDFGTFYDKNKKFFSSLIDKSQLLSIKNEQTRTVCYNNKFFDHILLNKYISMLTSLTDKEVGGLFPLMKNFDDSSIKSLQYNEIERQLHKSIEDKEINDFNGYYLSSILYISIVTLSYLKERSPIFSIIASNSFSSINIGHFINEAVYALYHIIKSKRNKIDKEYNGGDEMQIINYLLYFLTKNNIIPHRQLYKIANELSIIESKSKDKIEKSNVLLPEFSANKNNFDNCSIEFACTSKKKSKVEVATIVKNAFRDNKFSRYSISISLNNALNKKTYTARLETSNSLYEKSYSVLCSYMKENQITEANRGEIVSLIVNIFACSSLEDAIKVDLSGFLNVLTILNN